MNLKLIKESIVNDSDIPKFLKEKVSDLLAEGKSGFPEISLKTKAIDSSYLEFLREQIELKPRGEEWDFVLKNRLNKLEPWVGKELIFMQFECESKICFIRLHPQTYEIIHWECT